MKKAPAVQTGPSQTNVGTSYRAESSLHPETAMEKLLSIEDLKTNKTAREMIRRLTDELSQRTFGWRNFSDLEEFVKSKPLKRRDSRSMREILSDLRCRFEWGLNRKTRSSGRVTAPEDVN